ncbi:MAG: MFS transporter [Planctomycetota bacterium]
MKLLLRWIGVKDASREERRATLWLAAMFFCALSSTFVLRPLRDQFGVAQGVGRMPHLYGLTLAVTLLFAPCFWWLANRRPSRTFIPLVLHAFAASMVALWIGFRWIGDYDWSSGGNRWFGEAFWGFFNAFNLAVPTLVWIHAVEHFGRDQGLRLFGLIGVGGTLGAICGSALSSWMTRIGAPPSTGAIASLVLLESACLCFRGSLPACEALGTSGRTRPPAAGVLHGLSLLISDRRLLGLAFYMLLIGIVMTAFAVAQTRLVGERIEGGRSQHAFLGWLEGANQFVVLMLQLFATGRLMRRLPAALFLSLLPALAVLGLSAVRLWPFVLTISLVQLARRAAQFALEKPAREVLYTPFDLETKHKVKFLLDTFVLRCGDFLGACFHVLVAGGSIGAVAFGTAGFAAVWAALGVFLGRRVQAPGKENPDTAQ